MVVLCRFVDFVSFIHYEAHVRHCRETETKSVCILVTLEAIVIRKILGTYWKLKMVVSGDMRINSWLINDCVPVF